MILSNEEFNKYSVFDQLNKLCEMVKSPHGGDTYRYSKIVFRGENELFCYNRGYLCLSIYPSCCLGIDNWTVRFQVTNIDDMMISAWSRSMDKLKAVDQCEKVANAFCDCHTLGTMEELNETLRPFGLYAEIE